MKLATVTIRNKHNGKTRSINQEDWATDLGVSRYAGWEVIGRETIAADDTDVVEEAAKKALADKRAEEEAAAAEAAKEEAAAEPEEKTVEDLLEEEETETLFGEGIARDPDLD